MKLPIWMNLRDALAIHDKMLTLYGGLSGVRDQGMLESALAKPMNLFAYGKPEIMDLATSYAAGVVHNHPFVDGNKRTGFTLAMTFLEINGYNFHATEADAAIQTLALAAGAIYEAQYAVWLKANTKRRR